MSSFADAMHFSGCRGEIKIENSHFKGMHDDPINVHGTHLKITEILSPVKLKIKFMHPQTYGIKAFFPGDSIAFVHPESLQVFAKNVIRSSELITPYEMLVELDRSAPKEMIKGDCLENLSWNPSLTVRNCRFESVNTRGLLVTTRGKVLIEGNTFYRTGMPAIMIGDDAMGWYESGPVEDVVIRNNNFEECAYGSAPDNYVIAIVPENHLLLKDYYVHHNIRIENNTFKVYDAPLLTARSTDGLVFSNNNIVQSDFMQRGGNKNAFNLVACKKITIAKIFLTQNGSLLSILIKHCPKN
ncbi:MAG: right-handed parallel beta-helix repeat-containing protein [Bacteroidota bacterium]